MDSDSPGSSDNMKGLLVVHTGCMYILVTAASKRGSTYEIAETIAHRFEDTGHSADVVAPAAVESMDPCDMIVCGSTMCILWWMGETKNSLEHFAEQLKTKRVWAFSVGTNGVSKYAPQDPTRIGLALTHVFAIDKHTFAGCYKPSLLSLRERPVACLTGVVEGDFRDWSEVEAWADPIITELSDKS